jgi:hypothetical protein
MLTALFRRHGGDHVKFVALRLVPVTELLATPKLHTAGGSDDAASSNAAAGLLLAALDVDTLEAPAERPPASLRSPPAIDDYARTQRRGRR